MDIRNLNKITLKEPFYRPAETLDGKPTRKKIIPGQYKELPNHVRTPTGENFKFAEPFEVPAKMGELVKWFNAEMQKRTLPIARFLAELHHRFIIIHPFDDGNGRVARLWTNYTLMRLGYPPMVIKSEDKENYYSALRKADTGDMDSLAVYLGETLIFWLEMGIKAGKGESIEEPSDIDKEVEIFKRDRANHEQGFLKNVENIFDFVFVPLVEALEERMRQFEDCFESTKTELKIDASGIWLTEKGPQLKFQRSEIHKIGAEMKKCFDCESVSILSRTVFDNYKHPTNRFGYKHDISLFLELEVALKDSYYIAKVTLFSPSVAKGTTLLASNKHVTKKTVLVKVQKEYGHIFTKEDIDCFTLECKKNIF